MTITELAIEGVLPNKCTVGVILSIGTKQYLVTASDPMLATDMYDNHANIKRMAAQAIDAAFAKELK